MSLALGDAVNWGGIPFEKPVIPAKAGIHRQHISEGLRSRFAFAGMTAHEVNSGRPGPEGRKASPAFGRPMRDMLLIPQ
jgi:hypothetical protein